MAHLHDSRDVVRSNRSRLSIVFSITVLVLVIEIVGGIVAHALVLIADAGHMATDAGGVALSLLALRYGRRPPSEARTFGSQRAEIIAAVLNALVLFGVGAFIVFSGVRRLIHPERPSLTLMVIFGAIALIGSGVSLVILRRAHGETLVLRGAYLEVLADVLGAVAILVAAGVIATTGFIRADALASIAIGALIVPRTARLLRESIEVLLESTPRNVDLARVRAHMCEIPGVLGVHDLHAWTITSNSPVLSAHVVIADGLFNEGGSEQVLDDLGECLASHFDVEHCTFQLEPRGHRDHEHVGHL